MMRRKSIGIIMIMLILTSSLAVMPDQKTINIVSADTQPPQPPVESINMTYVKNVTDRLSRVIFDAYNWSDPMELKKGRSFGSKGEQYAAEHIIKPEMDAIGLTNVTMSLIKQTEDKPSNNCMIEVLSKSFQVNDTEISDFFISPFWPVNSSRLYWHYTSKQFNPHVNDYNDLTQHISYENVPVFRRRPLKAIDDFYNSSIFINTLKNWIRNLNIGC